MKNYFTKHAYLFATKKILGVRCTLTKLNQRSDRIPLEVGRVLLNLGFDNTP